MSGGEARIVTSFVRKHQRPHTRLGPSADNSLVCIVRVETQPRCGAAQRETGGTNAAELSVLAS